MLKVWLQSSSSSMNLALFDWDSTGLLAPPVAWLTDGFTFSTITSVVLWPRSCPPVLLTSTSAPLQRNFTRITSNCDQFSLWRIPLKCFQRTIFGDILFHFISFNIQKSSSQWRNDSSDWTWKSSWIGRLLAFKRPCQLFYLSSLKRKKKKC